MINYSQFLAFAEIIQGAGKGSSIFLLLIAQHLYMDSLGALQAVFSKYCGRDVKISKSSV